MNARQPAEKDALADRALWRRVARTIERGQVPWDAIGALDTLAEGVLALDAALTAATLPPAEGRPVQGCTVCATYRHEDRACPTHRVIPPGADQ